MIVLDNCCGGPDEGMGGCPPWTERGFCGSSS